MTRGDVATLVDAVVDSEAFRMAQAVGSMALIVGFIGVLAAATAIDVALGRGDEWPA